MASPNPPLLNSKQHPDLLASLAPPARPWSPKAPSSTAVLPVEPELYLRVLARVAAASPRCLGQPMISAALALRAGPTAERVAPSGGLADHAGQLDQGGGGDGRPPATERHRAT